MYAATIFFIVSGVAFIASAIALVMCAIKQAPDEATSLVVVERQRQIQKEGYGAKHDERHSRGQLGAAAACYAMPEVCRLQACNHGNYSLVGAIWPWGAEWWKPTPSNRIRELSKAGALILAELEREIRIRDGASKGGAR